MPAATATPPLSSLPKPPHPALATDVLSTPSFDEKQWKRAQIAASHAFQKSTKAAAAPSIAPSHPPATSVLLQGKPRLATTSLFLFPDGSGSAASYTHLPLISPSLVVYGLNCPYLKTPQNWKCGPQHLTPLYISEIQRRQPRGPYFLGGYSTGGIAAFDAAQALERMGEKVERLILIDTPCPIHIQRLPSRLMTYLKSTQIFDSRGRQPPDWVFEHFEANTANLQKYRARPCEAYREPSTYIINAGQGVLEGVEKKSGVEVMEIFEDDSKEMKWVLGKRDDFGPMGWEKLLNGEDIHVEVAAGRVAGCLARAMGV
ncbi:hypothetical protein CLAFUW4_14268 [Fulvia fulva]|uniref:Conidial pigment polyketide synthase alb1 n=1 Tax=Passalora fulva TaxID=5499 RepID=A0A9Q8UWB8_PASFU|nr:Conidial pigment polyketide synthase alb1 [Fulvia fulva]UJO24851.1 Conidial pigment polyketide synthase alb1 [Fulvia fulva]WPV22945.1 hypothetical protein CLAFUW4_14268 [Fulvia fulva]